MSSFDLKNKMKIARALNYTNFDETAREIDLSEVPVALGLFSISRNYRDAANLPSEKIVSFHGPNVPLNKKFLPDIRKAANIALALGQDSITLHPHKVKGADENERLRQQEEALECIDIVEKTSGCKIEVETFAGRNRILRPREIVELGLPLVIDTSHIDSLDVYELLEVYRNNVPTLHLSERNIGEQHQPITAYGESLVELLRAQKWDGTVVLEYMPQLQDRAAADAKYLINVLDGFDRTKDSPEMAVENFNLAVKTKPNGYLAEYGLGLVDVLKGNGEKAIDHLKRAENVHPGNYGVLLLLSKAYELAGQDGDAHDTFRKLKQLFPSSFSQEASYH